MGLPMATACWFRYLVSDCLCVCVTKREKQRGHSSYLDVDRQHINQIDQLLELNYSSYKPNHVYHNRLISVPLTPFPAS
jgi:hypothetical protein